MEKNRLSDGDPSIKLHRYASARGKGAETSRRSLHVCIVTETYPPEVNGVALTLGHLIGGMLARGHAVSIVRPRQHASDRTGAGVTLVGGLPLPGYKGLQFGLPSGGLLQQLWMRQRPDVVYVATEGPLGWSAVRIARRLAIPAFSGFHTNFHSYSRHYGVGWLCRFVFWYLRRFHNQSTGTIVPGLELRDRLQALGFKNVNYLGRGVDSRLFDPGKRSAEIRRNWGVGEREIALLYVGRVAREKNLPLAIDAYHRVKQFAGSAKFIIVGDGPLYAELHARHRDVIFCGMITGEPLAAHYASADVFLFPSETETFGNVTLEAMASGLAVVAFDYAAARWHIVGGETGILVPYADSDAFVNAAAGLISDPEQVREIGRRAREYAASIGWERVVERFEMLLTGRARDLPSAFNAAAAARPIPAAARGRT